MEDHPNYTINRSSDSERAECSHCEWNGPWRNILPMKLHHRILKIDHDQHRREVQWGDER